MKFIASSPVATGKKPVPNPPAIPTNPTVKSAKVDSDDRRLQFEAHQGPLPAPSVLHEYDQVSPGLAERIVRMAEKQQTHRHMLEDRSLNADIEYANSQVRLTALGQVASFLTSAFGIGGAIYVALHGQQWIAGVIGTGGLGGLIVAIIRAVKKKSD